MSTLKFEFRLVEADREKYVRGDEWYLFSVDTLYQSTGTELAALEKAMGGYRVAKMLVELDDLGAQALRAAMWIARRQAGIHENWPAFDPIVLSADIRDPEPAEPEDDAVPPDTSPGESSTSSATDPPTTSPSESDPTSPAPTPASPPLTSGT